MATGSALPWFVGLLTASVSLLVGNKYIAQHYDAHNLTILFQNSVAAVILYIGGFRTKHFDMKPLQVSQFKAMSIPAMLNSLQLLTSMKALPYVAVATTVVFRNVSTLLCAFIENIYFGVTFSKKAKLALVLIFLGSVVYAYKDLTFNFIGYAWLCGNTSVYTINNIYIKLTVTKMDQTGSGVALVTTLITLPMFTMYAFCFNEIPVGVYDLGNLPLSVTVVFLFLGLMGTLIAMSYNNLYKIVSATSVVVASNMNKVAAIFLAWFVFKKPINVIQMAGLAMCMLGGCWYGVQTKWDKMAESQTSDQVEMPKYQKVATEEGERDSSA